MNYRNIKDLTNVVDTAYDDGVAEGVAAMQKRADEADKRAEEEKARADALFAELQKLKGNTDH